MQRLFFALVLAYVSVSCATKDGADALPPVGPLRCEHLVRTLDWAQPIQVLNHTSSLFHNGCYRETAATARKAREKFRYKNYSVTKEAAELFLAEGTVTDYVLESYERGYLSFLTALSYAKLKDEVGTTVELNRFYNEEVAAMYNHGQDPVNALLQAALWDNFPREGFSSRPFWLWITKSDGSDKELKAFAKKRVAEIDKKLNSTAPWQITEIGAFPQVNWSMQFNDSQSGYFSITPARPFVSTCAEAQSILVPTSSWFHKIAIRHSHAYHPLVNVKSWIRLPFGIAYGVTTMAAGASIAVGGCALDIAGKGDGSLCKVSIAGGAALMAKTDDVVDYALSPDMRHWENLPAAIYVRKQGMPAERCLTQVKDARQRPLL